MTTYSKATEAPPGYLSYGELRHMMIRKRACQLCGVEFQGPPTAKNCEACRPEARRRRRRRYAASARIRIAA